MFRTIYDFASICQLIRTYKSSQFCKPINGWRGELNTYNCANFEWHLLPVRLQVPIQPDWVSRSPGARLSRLAKSAHQWVYRSHINGFDMLQCLFVWGGFCGRIAGLSTIYTYQDLLFNIQFQYQNNYQVTDKNTIVQLCFGQVNSDGIGLLQVAPWFEIIHLAPVKSPL